MKHLFVLLFFCFPQFLFAQQKPAAKILIDTSDYKIEQIDVNDYNTYLSGSSHHSGMDTVNNGATVKCYSPYTDNILYIENKNNQPGAMNQLSLYHGDHFTEEQLTYKISIPLANYNIEFAHWLFSKSAVLSIKTLSNNQLHYLLVTFKRL